MRKAGGLSCLVFSKAGLFLAQKLAVKLAAFPWHEDCGTETGKCEIFAPAGLWQRASAPEGISPLDNIKAKLAEIWKHGGAIIFIGATGIAVRMIAPLIGHKSCDPAIIAIDAAGKFCVALLSGHLGGANSLATHIANLIGAQPVITTATDCLNSGHALDLELAAAGLKIIDWQELPRVQAAILEGERIGLCDPLRLLPGAKFPASPNPDSFSFAIAIDWRERKARPGLLRVAAPVVYIGAGFRKNVKADQLAVALRRFIAEQNISPIAIAGVATIREKAAVLGEAAARLGFCFQSFAAPDLAARPTPNPSVFCGQRFNQKPFSVCEAAAILAAGAGGKLAIEKTIYDKSITFALALGKIAREEL